MNLTIKGTDKSFRLSNVVRPTTKRLKPKSNLIVPSSLLTDLDRRSQLRNENRSFQEKGRRGKVNTSPEPILSIRFKSRRTERGAPFEKKRAWGIEVDDVALEDLSKPIYILVVSEVANAIGSINRCIPRIIVGCPPLFVSKLRSFIERRELLEIHFRDFSSVIEDKSPSKGTIPSRGTRDQTPPPGVAR